MANNAPPVGSWLWGYQLPWIVHQTIGPDGVIGGYSPIVHPATSPYVVDGISNAFDHDGVLVWDLNHTEMFQGSYFTPAISDG